ncbi:MAG TPA: GspE/PulE family protein, partial [Armatimonadota bacterium]|nr:GspE/PulE family protein [Armatimonadota bacterium]
DGNCRLRVDRRVIDLRASTLPGVHGEITVFRVLTRDTTLQKLEALGFEPDTLQAYNRLLHDPHGMILVTGPTGSGKTTTLYASVNQRNTDSVNIITVEDPVEIRLPGVNQVQVEERAGRTFAGTLRAMLRQDPDIIMVGEIRDAETAEIACRAALTGHMVLSTLHARHALGTIARLADMGVPRYPLAACLNGIMAQRLLRRVCEECAQPYELPAGVRDLLEQRFGDLQEATFRKGTGCAACHRTGFHGRIGIYELVTVDERLRRMLADGASRRRLKAHADDCGFRTMESDAFRKAARGVICPEEVLRLSSWSDEEDEP